jgi:hypothetical protein
MKQTRTRVCTVTCSHCGEEIYSRARHDFRYCKCGRTNVDGGFDYLKYGWGNGDAKPRVRIRYVGFTRPEIINDWNARIDKLGVIAGKGAK